MVFEKNDFDRPIKQRVCIKFPLRPAGIQELFWVLSVNQKPIPDNIIRSQSRIIDRNDAPPIYSFIAQLVV